MRCPQCQFENREGVRFCEKCGAKLEQACPSCGNPVPPDRNFCGACGHALTGAPLVEQYPGYAKYERRAGVRRIPVMLMEPL